MIPNQMDVPSPPSSLPTMASVSAFLSQNLPVMEAESLAEQDAEFDAWLQQRTEHHRVWLEHGATGGLSEVGRGLGEVHR